MLHLLIPNAPSDLTFHVIRKFHAENYILTGLRLIDKIYKIEMVLSEEVELSIYFRWGDEEDRINFKNLTNDASRKKNETKALSWAVPQKEFNGGNGEAPILVYFGRSMIDGAPQLYGKSFNHKPLINKDRVISGQLPWWIYP